MDEDRREAYRDLIYHAMLLLRAYPTWPVQGIKILSLRAWRQARHQAMLRSAIANWLHNLADYSARDFEGFSENAFWHEGRNWRRKYPEFDSLKMHYDCKLFEIRNGTWPDPGTWPNTRDNTFDDLGDDHRDNTSLEFPFEEILPGATQLG